MRELKTGDRIRASWQSKKYRTQDNYSWLEGEFSHYEDGTKDYGRMKDGNGFFVDSVIFLDEPKSIDLQEDFVILYEDADGELYFNDDSKYSRKEAEEEALQMVIDEENESGSYLIMKAVSRIKIPTRPEAVIEKLD